MGVTAEQVREVVETDWSNNAILRAIRDAERDVEVHLGPVSTVEVTEHATGPSGAHLRWPASRVVSVNGEPVGEDVHGAQYLPGRTGEVVYKPSLSPDAADQVVLDLVVLTLSYRGAIKSWSDGSLSESGPADPSAYRRERDWLLRHPAGGRSVV